MQDRVFRPSAFFKAIFLILAFTQGPTEGFAQEASVLDLVTECDILAAHPNDPDRFADGVADDEIVPKLAIMACETVIAEKPDEARHRFQVGRALLAAGKKPEAFAQFTSAADSGYAAAWAYLGDAYQFGYGTPADTTKAFNAYKKAYEGGFELAKDQINQLQFDPKMYTGEFLSLFFNSDFDTVAAKSSDSGIRSLVRNYVFNLTLTFITECGSAVVTPANVPRFYAYRYPSGWTAQADEQVSVAIQTSISEQDSQTFIKRHGCEGAVAKHLFAQIDSFFSQPQ